jgi:hypothetical protein
LGKQTAYYLRTTRHKNDHGDLYSVNVTAKQDGIATRSDIERALWFWSGWKADQRCVDALLEVIDRYAAGDQQTMPPSPEPEEQPAGPLTEVVVEGISTKAYRDPRGAVWVRLDTQPVPWNKDERPCTLCKQTKPVLQFRKDARATNGRRAQCRECENGKARMRRAAKHKG